MLQRYENESMINSFFEENKQTSFQKFFSSLFSSSKNLESKLFKELNDPKKYADYMPKNPESFFEDYFDSSVQSILKNSSPYLRPNKENVSKAVSKAYDNQIIAHAASLIGREEKIYTQSEKDFLKRFFEQFKNPPETFVDNLKNFDFKKHSIDKGVVDTLNKFLTQSSKYYKNLETDNSYESTLKKLKASIKQVKNSVEISEENKVSSTEYFNIIELTDDTIQCYGNHVKTVSTITGILDIIDPENESSLTELRNINKKAKVVISKFEDEFQKEAKEVFKNGDMLQTVVDQESKVIPGLHDNDKFADKVYFFLKNKITKHGHSALIVHDEKDGKIHLSHIVNKYRNNELKPHHLLFSNIYRLDLGDKETQEQYEKTQKGLYDAFSGHLISENSDSRKIVSGILKTLFNILGGILKVFRGVQSKDESIDRAYINKTVDTKENLMFCSEFVAESINAGIHQIKAERQINSKKNANSSKSESDLNYLLKTSNAKELPPQEMIDKLEREGKVRIIIGEEKANIKKIPLLNAIKTNELNTMKSKSSSPSR